MLSVIGFHHAQFEDEYSDTLANEDNLFRDHIR